MAYAALTCRVLIGLVFAVSAFTKVRTITAYREFASWLASVPLPLAGHGAVPPFLAGAEAAIVILVAIPATVLPGLVLAAVTLAVLTTGSAVAVARAARVTCRCFGSSRTPLALRHVLRNGFLLAGAVAGALAGAVAGARGTSAIAPHPAAIALSLVAAMAAATFVVFLDDLAAVAGAGWAGPR
jgi:hypothetical protein